MSFADELGIKYPANISRGDLSDLITIAKGKRHASVKSGGGGIGCAIIVLAVVGWLVWRANQPDKQPDKPPTAPSVAPATRPEPEASPETIKPEATPATPEAKPKPEASPKPKPEPEAPKATPKATEGLPPGFRIWSDSTGTYKTRAKFGGMASGKVKLIKEDGSTVQIPLEKLSDEDQDWINAKRR
jgi:type IV secretory pathway VirB10-like protein